LSINFNLNVVKHRNKLKYVELCGKYFRKPIPVWYSDFISNQTIKMYIAKYTA
jgi:hypothetical protein